MIKEHSHWLNVRNKSVLLHRLMVEFAGGRMSLEGDLSKCKFTDDLVVPHEEVGLLKRITLYPIQDFVVLKLEPANIAYLFKQVLAAGFRAIIHVQIEHAGVLELGAYDNFHSECVVAGPGVSESLLDDLKSKNVLRDYSKAVEDNC